MLKVIEKRRSVREYKHKVIHDDTMSELMSILDNQPDMYQDESVEFIFLKDGKQVYENMNIAADFKGETIKAPHYMVVLAEKKSHYLLIAGYLAEWFILHSTRLGIGTCWIETVNKSDQMKTMLNIESDKEMVGLIAMGYSKGGFKQKHNDSTSHIGRISPFTSLGYSNIELENSQESISLSKALNEIVFINNWGEKASMEILDQYGMSEVFYYMRMAPSWGNREPWKFIVSGEGILLLIERPNLVMDNEEDNSIVEIDAGIAMIYFEVAMHGEGMPGHWYFDCDTDKYEIPEDYFIAGCYAYKDSATKHNTFL